MASIIPLHGPWNLSALEELDGRHFYVENVRSLLKVSIGSAELYCETCVRHGLLKRGMEILDPAGNVAYSGLSSEQVPEQVQTLNEQGDAYVLVDSAELRSRVFYSVND